MEEAIQGVESILPDERPFLFAQMELCLLDFDFRRCSHVFPPRAS